MSRCLNKAMLIGNLGADPEIRTVGNGARVAQLSLATTRRWNGSDGQAHEKTEWHRVVIWSSLSGTFNFVEKYVRKGDRIYVEGEIEYRQYEARDGSGTRYTTEIRASEVMSAGTAGGGNAGERESGSSARSSAGSRSRTREMAGVGAGPGGGYDGYEAPPFEEDDDLPF